MRSSSKNQSLSPKELWSEIARYNRYATHTDAKDFYMAIVKVISVAVKKSGKIVLPYLGTFKLVREKQRYMRDYRSGVLVQIPQKYLLKFEPCESLRVHFKELDERGELAHLD